MGAGAAGPGKSVVLTWEPLQQIRVEHSRCEDPDFIPPGFDRPYPIDWHTSKGCALHLRRTSPMLEETIKRTKEWFPAIDPGAEWRESDLQWTFSSGYRYKFGHCKDPDDWGQFLSKEFTMILYDELTQFNEDQYDHINTRLRTSDPVLGRMLKVRAMSNPLTGREHMDGVTLRNPHWVRDRFV